MKDPCMSVNCVAWSPNGSFIGKFKEIKENSLIWGDSDIVLIGKHIFALPLNRGCVFKTYCAIVFLP